MMDFLDNIKLKIREKQKNKASLPKLNLFKNKYFKIYIITVLFLSAVIVLIIFMQSLNKSKKIANDINNFKQIGKVKEEMAKNHPTFKDIAYIGGFRDFRPKAMPIRNIEKVWSPEEVDKHWVNIEEIGIENIEKDNFRTLVDYFEKEGR